MFHFRHAAKNAEKVITVSEQSRTDIVNILGIDDTKVVSIPNGVSDEFYRIDDSERLESFRVKHGLADNIILCVCTLQPRKNIDVAIKAFSELKKHKKIPHQLVIVGRTGWLWKDTMKLVSELNLRYAVIARGKAPKQSQARLLRSARNDKNDVVFIGAVEDKELPLFYNLAEVFLNPSSYEGFGLTCLEAMACGVPVIATNVSSFPEVVGDAGILVTPRSVEELSQAVYSVLHDNSLKDELIRKGLERVKRYSWAQTAEKTIGVYKEVLQ
jgi:glycosyltransferase involved in cell wall biosynthesis